MPFPSWLSGVLVPWVLVLPLRAQETPPDPRPNFVFVLTDDQRHDLIGRSETFPFLELPALERLAAEGTRFENAFVTTSLCSPSRASILTGTYAFRHGVITNEYNDPDEDLATFPRELQKAGYETAFIGKWHMRPDPAPRPGFDHWVSFRGQGKYRDFRLNVDGETVACDRYLTDELTERSLAFLARERRGPFALVLQHKAIHSPYQAAARHKDSYAKVDLPVFDLPEDELEAKPQWLAENRRKSRAGHPPQGVRAQRIRDMLSTLRSVDEGLGRILDHLEEEGILDRTVVVFTSDNGLLFGEHGGLGDKRKAYDPSMRVPLLVRYPARFPAGKRAQAMALNIDVAPTVLELAGVEIPASMQGRSLVPLATGARDARPGFLYEYYREFDYRPRGGFGGPPTTLAVRTHEWKYIRFPELPDEVEELYHLASDPHELRNLARLPEHEDDLSRLRGTLEQLKVELEYRSPPKVERNPRLLKLREKRLKELGEEDEDG